MRDAGVLRVRLDGATRELAGGMQAVGDRHVFRPAFPFARGLTYQVEADGCAASFSVPAPPAPRPEVVAVYPRSQTIPENVLRFYVQFSEPMAQGDALSHVRLEHVESGTDLSGVFFDNIHELWSADRRRLTLLVDPGRVKTGLRANLALGRAFQAGQHYRLHLLESWRSVRGESLLEPFVAEFTAIAEDKRRVRPETWCIRLPASGTHEPLVVDFGEPVDHVSVGWFLRVVAPNGNALKGRWNLQHTDTRATWTPERPWHAPPEQHDLAIQGRFEDIAGNNLNAAMEHAVGALPGGGEGQLHMRRIGDGCQLR